MKGQKKAFAGYEPTVIVGTKRLPDKIEISVKDNGNGFLLLSKTKSFNVFYYQTNRTRHRIRIVAGL
jgi:K+-sensing histidine kinase KdpD